MDRENERGKIRARWNRQTDRQACAHIVLVRGGGTNRHVKYTTTTQLYMHIVAVCSNFARSCTTYKAYGCRCNSLNHRRGKGEGKKMRMN